MTLIELLVVVSILLLLAVIAVPMLQPSLESRRIRETARAVNVLLSSAQSRAMETGRPHGVQIIRDPQAPNAGVELIPMEVPPVFAGQCLVMQDISASPGLVLKVLVRSADFDTARIAFGAMAQINDQGPFYRVGAGQTQISSVADFVINPVQPIDFITGKTSYKWQGVPYISSHWLTLVLSPMAAPDLPWKSSPSPPTNFVTCGSDEDAAFFSQFSGPVSIKVYGVPVPSAAAPLELSPQTPIDLAFSGTGNSTSGSNGMSFGAANNADRSPVTIMFAPSGGIDSFYTQGIQRRLREPVYLLVGRQERVPNNYNPAAYVSLAEDALLNYQDLENLWIAVNAQTGQTAVTPMNEAATSGTHWERAVSTRGFAELGEQTGGR